MRGHYFEDKATVTPTGPYHVTGISTPSRETIASLVAFAAHKALQNHLAFYGEDGSKCFASLLRDYRGMLCRGSA